MKNFQKSLNILKTTYKGIISIAGNEIKFISRLGYMLLENSQKNEVNDAVFDLVENGYCFSKE